MTAPPLVSIVMPTFNRLHLLPATVESVRAQTVSRWELLIADDGSDADTHAYLQALARDSRIRVLWLAHSGRPATGRNAGLAQARGDHVAFLDSDDVWMPRKLDCQLQALRAAPDRQWCYTGFTEVDADGRDLQGAPGHCEPCPPALFDALVKGPIPIRTPSVVLARRSLLQAAGGFDSELAAAEDVDLWMRLALLSPAVVLKEPLVQVRRHAQSLSHRLTEVHAGRERSLCKLEGQVDPDRRLLLRRERARNALQLAAVHAASGDRDSMWRTLRESAAYAWSCPAWWVGLVKVPLKAHVPPGVLALYRWCRGLHPT